MQERLHHARGGAKYRCDAWGWTLAVNVVVDRTVGAFAGGFTDVMKRFSCGVGGVVY